MLSQRLAAANRIDARAEGYWSRLPEGPEVHMSDKARVKHGPASMLVMLLLAGCAGQIGPSAPKAERAASGTAAGVEVVAETGAWRGWPTGLTNLVTPVRVRLVNGGGVQLRLDPTLFTLVLSDGRRLAAAPVSDVRAVVPEPPPPSQPIGGLTLGPVREQSGSDWALNRTAPDPRYDPVQQVGREWELPSADMVESALPVGEVAPGASASGFVFFQRVPPGSVAVTLTARLLDARSGEPIGVVAVPLERP
jgi:hypothetical protein